MPIFLTEFMMTDLIFFGKHMMKHGILTGEKHHPSCLQGAFRNSAISWADQQEPAG